MELVLATRNRGKAVEISALFAGAGLGLSIITLDALGVARDIDEDGATFEENAVKKAAGFMKLTGRAALADDSGLEVDALGGRPGVHSARFLGHATPYREKNRKLLAMLKNAETRAARFRSVVAVAFPGGRVLTASGALEGEIARRPRGNGGFGYDPVFYLPEYKMTLGQMGSERKNQISHRAKALAGMIELLRGDAGQWT